MSAQGSPAGSEAARRAALISSRAALMSAQRCQAPWQPCADILAALRCHRGSPALPSRQPCAALLAALLEIEAALRAAPLTHHSVGKLRMPKIDFPFMGRASSTPSPSSPFAARDVSMSLAARAASAVRARLQWSRRRLAVLSAHRHRAPRRLRNRQQFLSVTQWRRRRQPQLTLSVPLVVMLSCPSFSIIIQHQSSIIQDHAVVHSIPVPRDVAEQVIMSSISCTSQRSATIRRPWPTRGSGTNSFLK